MALISPVQSWFDPAQRCLRNGFALKFPPMDLPSSFPLHKQLFVERENALAGACP